MNIKKERMDIERPPVNDGLTIHDVVDLIGKVDDTELQYKIIKRLIHSEKSSVYRRCQSDYADEQFIELKLKTHRKLHQKLDEEIQPLLWML